MKNKNTKLIVEVAKWEFNRWFKIKEQVITILVGGLISLLIFGSSFLLKSSADEIKIKVINGDVLSLNFKEGSLIKLFPANKNEVDQLKNALNEKEINGILVFKSVDDVEVIVNKEPSWLSELHETIISARQKIKLEQSNISQEQLTEIFKPIEIKLIYAGDAKEQSSVADKITAGVFIGIMLVGIFLGLAYQFVAITGEKQLRITEVIVSAISPQTWIDGKILGISLLSLALLVTFLISSIVFVIISMIFDSGWSLPIAATNPVLMITLLFFSISGFLFWNTFFAAIAATINDPNTSARGSLMMLPFLPVTIAFFALGNPDSIAIRILSVFPLTSAPVMSARLVLTDVGWGMIIVSLLAMNLTTWYIRKFAGKIFSLSILMYGKEPSWGEMMKWVRR